jgi:hypothetical protein
MNIDNLIGLKIESVLYKGFKVKTSGYDNIVIKTPEGYLNLKADNETDELILAILPSIDEKAYTSPSWAVRLIDKQIVGFWKVENQQGYLDLLSLGLNAFIPSVIFSTIASEIKVGFIAYFNAKKKSRDRV